MEFGSLEDKEAYHEFNSLIDKFKPNRIIETGSYLGWSSKRLANFGIPVDTIEISKKHYNSAKNYLIGIDNINIHQGSSNLLLEQILEENEKNILFFLDAHWGEYWPLLDELEVIFRKKIENPIIIVHDVFIPGGNKLRKKWSDGYYTVEDGSGSKFGYDEYSGVPLSYEYIKNKLDKIYNNNYDYHYTSKIDCVDSGLIYVYPKIN